MTAQQTPDRDQLRKLANAATPGPWEAITVRYDSEIGGYMGGHIPGVADEFPTDFSGDLPPLSAEDAEFIAAARTAVPALLDQLDQAEARIQAVRDMLDNLEQQPAEQIGWDVAALLPDIRHALDDTP